MGEIVKQAVSNGQNEEKLKNIQILSFVGTIQVLLKDTGIGCACVSVLVPCFLRLSTFSSHVQPPPSLSVLFFCDFIQWKTIKLYIFKLCTYFPLITLNCHCLSRCQVWDVLAWSEHHWVEALQLMKQFIHIVMIHMLHLSLYFDVSFFL